MRPILVIVTAMSMTACGGYVSFNANPGANTNANANTNVVVNRSADVPAVNANVASNTNANVAAKPVDSGPKRITFGKGADWTSENVTLAAGQSKQYVVGANVGQYLTVQASSPDVKMLMISKKNVGVEQEGSSLGAALGAKGDYIFEVRNPGNKEVKTSIRIQITDEGGE